MGFINQQTNITGNHHPAWLLKTARAHPKATELQLPRHPPMPRWRTGNRAVRGSCPRVLGVLTINDFLMDRIQANFWQIHSEWGHNSESSSNFTSILLLTSNHTWNIERTVQMMFVTLEHLTNHLCWQSSLSRRGTRRVLSLFLMLLGYWM